METWRLPLLRPGRTRAISERIISPVQLVFEFLGFGFWVCKEDSHFTLPIVIHLFNSFTTYLELFSEMELTDVLPPPICTIVQHLYMNIRYKYETYAKRCIRFHLLNVSLA